MSTTPRNEQDDPDLVRASWLRWPRWIPAVVTGLAILLFLGLAVEGVREVGHFLWPMTFRANDTALVEPWPGLRSGSAKLTDRSGTLPVARSTARNCAP